MRRVSHAGGKRAELIEVSPALDTRSNGHKYSLSTSSRAKSVPEESGRA